MFKKVYGRFLVTFVLLVSLIFPSTVFAQGVTSQQNDNFHITAQKVVTVYITRTGSKYHRSGCRYLSRSKIAIKLSEAKKYYDPCKVCNPPR